jgi:hypothetical protein
VFVGEGTLRINIEPYRLIMVSADQSRSMIPDPLNHLVRSRAVIDKVAQAPELIEALLGEGFEGSEIAVNIRDDGYLHETELRANECEGGEISTLKQLGLRNIVPSLLQVKPPEVP